MKHTFQFARSQNILWVFSDTLYERQRRWWSAIHGGFSSNLGKSDQPIHQPIRTPDSGETSSQLETSNRRECEKCLLKKINQFILCLAIAFVEILSRMNCLIWPKIVILQLFSLVSSQMCSLKRTCQNRFKFPYDHCFHICLRSGPRGLQFFFNIVQNAFDYSPPLPPNGNNPLSSFWKRPLYFLSLLPPKLQRRGLVF